MSKEMTPKEALQMIQDNLTPRVLGILTVEFNIVEKALDRLELLEKNNQEIEKLYLNENKHWCETIDSLRKENQDLKEDLRLTTIERNVCENIYEALEEKYFKLKKIIEILKDKLNIRLHILTNTDGSKIYEIEFILGYYSTIYDITQQEYKLLKEVLESGGN